MISDLISRRSPSAVASATAGSCIALTPTRLKISQTCYHRNQQYSIVGLTNAAGTLVERYTYNAYGTLGIYAANGTVRTTSSYNNRYTYTGREWDADLRLYHFRARWYDPTTGGFVSRDPLGYVDGMSLYRGYFGVRGVDPSGTILFQERAVNDNIVAITIPTDDVVSTDMAEPKIPWSIAEFKKGNGPFSIPKPNLHNLLAMRRSLLSCCVEASQRKCVEAIHPSCQYIFADRTCEDEVDLIVRQVEDCYLKAMLASSWGRPVFAIYSHITAVTPIGRDGWYCDLCEECVGKRLEGLRWFRYEKMRTDSDLGHTWGQVRCRANNSRLGVIDIWERFERPWIPIATHRWSVEDDALGREFKKECVAAHIDGVPTVIAPPSWYP